MSNLKIIWALALDREWSRAHGAEMESRFYAAADLVSKRTRR